MKEGESNSAGNGKWYSSMRYVTYVMMCVVLTTIGTLFAQGQEQPRPPEDPDRRAQIERWVEDLLREEKWETVKPGKTVEWDVTVPLPAEKGDAVRHVVVGLYQKANPNPLAGTARTMKEAVGDDPGVQRLVQGMQGGQLRETFESLYGVEFTPEGVWEGQVHSNPLRRNENPSD